ncbi:MAG TPA: hypothetical protein H9715_10765 [Candidatus Merdibacter merdigallinarum]|uniref:DUF5668 domain-containing protein n=1 Tax=Amedibacillus dolichus TaxID=31971 RepID=A0ABT7UB33_9FIRM|nr:hypothetical protein [Amedibacillus dolichus]MDM8156848.1 hypothetical protein [Amedibacillus dolichus]HJB06221.1 hypothetical protein [Candidatus Merdibacter merdigallinarum]
MRQRAGMILCIAGMLLLFAPDVNYRQFLLNAAAITVEHWPIGLVILGLILLRPHKGKRRS